jgi:ribosome biogenesis protein MAK21
MSSGTVSDKISALTLSVQESPVHNMKALEGLVGLARKRSRGQAVEVLGALKDLLGAGALLPPDRKLKTFASQPGCHAIFASHPTWKPQDRLPAPFKEAHLISWAYEDWLKLKYFETIQILETRCGDEVTFARVKAVDYVYQLLRDKPEQEANLLRLLVNKLGDSNKKIASRTSYNILQLEAAHPRMKSIIIRAMESDVIFRPGQSLHAIYYATITLNQTVLSGKEEEMVKKLLDIYFSLFVKLLEKPKTKKPLVAGSKEIIRNKKGEVQGGGGAPGKKALRKATAQETGTGPDDDVREKILSAVLTGVNRALPFTSTNDEA